MTKSKIIDEGTDINIQGMICLQGLFWHYPVFMKNPSVISAVLEVIFEYQNANIFPKNIAISLCLELSRTAPPEVLLANACEKECNTIFHFYLIDQAVSRATMKVLEDKKDVILER